MNPRSLLVTSLCLNLCLVAVVVWLAGRSTSSPVAVAPASAPGATASPEGPKKSSAEPAKPAQAFDWRAVESEDYRKYIANLRAIGCPEETIRDIIIADVNKLFESRKQALKAKTGKKYEYWKAGNMFANFVDEEKIKATQELNRERRALLKELLGIEPEEKPDVSALAGPLESMLDFLPANKQTEVTELMQKFQAKIMKGLSGGAPDADDIKNMVKVRKEMEAELSKLLTPQELEDYHLRLSETSMLMRMQMSTFDPNEQEFKDIFKLRKSFDDEYPMMLAGALDKDEQAKRKAAEKELNSGIKSLLGDTRYAEYERGQDAAYQSLAKTAEKNGLPKDSAVKVYDMKKIAEEQARKVRSDKSLNPEQRQAALEGIHTETERSVREVFGEQAFDSYQKSPTASWLKRLNPAPKP
jgi:hypothetical protein